MRLRASPARREYKEKVRMLYYSVRRLSDVLKFDCRMNKDRKGYRGNVLNRTFSETEANSVSNTVSEIHP